MAETEQKSTAAVPFPTKALYAKKVGMTQFFDSHGLAFGATILTVEPSRVIQVKTLEKDGYDAVQIAYGNRSKKNLPKSQLGHFEKATSEPAELVREVRLKDSTHGLEKGKALSLEGVFTTGDYVDVRGVTKGHGFAGGVKRWNFRGGPATHGQSDRLRAPGSLAGRRSLGRVLPGKKMAGHYGVETSTVYKMEVLKVDTENQQLYVNGGVPGAKGSYVFVHETVKSRKKKIAVVASGPSAKKKAVKAAAPAKK